MFERFVALRADLYPQFPHFLAPGGGLDEKLPIFLHWHHVNDIIFGFNMAIDHNIHPAQIQIVQCCFPFRMGEKNDEVGVFRITHTGSMF